MNQGFLLENDTAKNLYAAVADLPILDYHCHLNPQQIYQDKPFESAGELIFGQDHYKWRLMRSAGIAEEYITGNAAPQEKFRAYARALSRSVGNPLVDFTALELYHFFGMEERLREDNAAQIYMQVEKKILSEKLSPQKIVQHAGVTLIATTDDPVDSLQWHEKLAASAWKVRVIPSFRTDRLFAFEREYLTELGDVAKIKICSLQDLEQALARRLTFFRAHGCLFSDVGIENFPKTIATQAQAEQIFSAIYHGKTCTQAQYDALRGWLFVRLGVLYRQQGICMQWHMAVKRNTCQRLYQQYGTDCGADSMGEAVSVESIAHLLNAIEQTADAKGQKDLPYTILYCLNPSMRDAMCSLAASFRNVHCGAAWWFLDHRQGIWDTLASCAQAGSLSAFPGMLTDSRSYLSYARHDFFRRILCSFLAQYVQDGTAAWEDVLQLAKMLCYENMHHLISTSNKNEEKKKK